MVGLAVGGTRTEEDKVNEEIRLVHTFEFLGTFVFIMMLC